MATPMRAVMAGAQKKGMRKVRTVRTRQNIDTSQAVELSIPNTEWSSRCHSLRMPETG